jgi:hypothetical protein
MGAQALARTEGVPVEVGEAATEPELFAVQKLLAVAGQEGYPETLERAARSGLLKLAEHPSRTKADYLHQLLAERSIGSPGGNPTCRAAAAEALVKMGFPYALEISPDDLALLKRTPRWGKKLRRTLAFLAAVSGAGLVLALASARLWIHWDGPESAAALAGAAAVLGGTLGTLFCPPKTDAQRLSRWVGLLGVAGSLFATVYLGPLCLVPVAAGMFAEVLLRPDR